MTRLGLVLSAVLSFVCVNGEEAVVTLTSQNFDEFVKNNPLALVEFYAPWCGHCKSLAPEYESAAKKLKEGSSPVPLAKVDATEEKDLAERFAVRGYPTLKFFRKGQPEEYDGGRTSATIIEWIEKRTGPAVKEFTSQKELDDFAAQKDVAFVLTTAKKDSALFQTFEKVADANRNAGSFLALVGGSEEKVEAVRKDEEKEKAADVSESGLEKFVETESFPLFGAINGENYGKYVGRGQDIIWACMSQDDAKKHAAAFRKVAKNYRESFSFVHLNTEEFGSHAENALGVSEFPAVVLQKSEGRYVFPDKDVDDTKLTQFLKDVASGKIEKSIKSEPIPETNDEPVKVVVAKNFEEMVLQKDKDVMLEVYAPWCGHCKKLEPLYKEFAQKLLDAKIEHVVVAKMDGTQNESPVEGFDWSGFPSLFWVKAGTTEPVKYNGARTVEGLVSFVKEHATQQIPHDEL